MHLNALYDLHKHTYTDALIQPVHCKDEFGAFCTMVDRCQPCTDTKTVFIGDRGYPSYNTMAHVGNFDFPDTDSFDIRVNVTLVRSHNRKIEIREGFHKRYVDANATFDYIAYGSHDTYDMSFRIVSFPISDNSYECIITNIPEDEFPVLQIKLLYFSRRSIEGSFRKLKYTIGLSSFHAYRPEYIMQEIWAKLIAYNITETMINHTVVNHSDTKHEYKVNFSMAAHICRIFLRPDNPIDSANIMALLKKELIPIRNERQYPRLQTSEGRGILYTAQHKAKPSLSIIVYFETDVNLFICRAARIPF